MLRIGREEYQMYLEKFKELDRREKERMRAEYQGLNIFQAIRKRITHKTTISELAEKYGIGF